MRFTSQVFRLNILAHSTNLNNLNASIDGFTNHIARSQQSKKISYRFVKEWAEILIETINIRF